MIIIRILWLLLIKLVTTKCIIQLALAPNDDHIKIKDSTAYFLTTKARHRPQV